MQNDPIVEEIRKIRQAHAASYNFDLAAICRALREEEARSSRPVVTRSPRLLDEQRRTNDEPQIATP